MNIQEHTAILQPKEYHSIIAVLLGNETEAESTPSIEDCLRSTCAEQFAHIMPIIDVIFLFIISLQYFVILFILVFFL